MLIDSSKQPIIDFLTPKSPQYDPVWQLEWDSHYLGSFGACLVNKMKLDAQNERSAKNYLVLKQIAMICTNLTPKIPYFLPNNDFSYRVTPWGPSSELWFVK